MFHQCRQGKYKPVSVYIDAKGRAKCSYCKAEVEIPRLKKTVDVQTTFKTADWKKLFKKVN